MDLHALSLGRSMMLTRGGIAFLVGVIATNQSGMSATSLVVLWGVWALLDGLATIRQGYPPSGTSSRPEARPVMLAMGGVAVAVGLLVVVVPGLSVGSVTWLLAGWFAIRAVFEVLGAAAARSSSARVLLGAAALVDIGLVAVFVTHTSGSVVDLALFGGGLALVWSLVYLTLALMTAPVRDWTPEGTRLLARR
jgi:uncharacterized membrane protein HdeD (DUF308 family)